MQEREFLPRRGMCSNQPLNVAIFSSFLPSFKSPGAGRHRHRGKIICLPSYFSKKKEGKTNGRGGKDTYLFKNYLI